MEHTFLKKNKLPAVGIFLRSCSVCFYLTLFIIGIRFSDNGHKKFKNSENTGPWCHKRVFVVVTGSENTFSVAHEL